MKKPHVFAVKRLGLIVAVIIANNPDGDDQHTADQEDVENLPPTQPDVYPLDRENPELDDEEDVDDEGNWDDDEVLEEGQESHREEPIEEPAEDLDEIHPDIDPDLDQNIPQNAPDERDHVDRDPSKQPGIHDPERTDFL